MGLNKEKSAPTGAVGEYWKIVTTDINWRDQVLVCVVHLFLDKASADAGKAMMDSSVFVYRDADFTFTESNLLTDLYTKIKTHADFVDATDVFEAGQP